jgi:hypothetical protein
MAYSLKTTINPGFNAVPANELYKHRLFLSENGLFIVISDFSYPSSRWRGINKVYYRTPGTDTWTLVFNSPSTIDNSQFGSGIHMSNNGGRIAIGYPTFDRQPNGDARLFDWNGSTYGQWWTFTTTYRGDFSDIVDATGTSIGVHKEWSSTGFDVSLSPNGNFVMVVATSENGTQNAGPSYVKLFQWNGAYFARVAYSQHMPSDPTCIIHGSSKVCNDGTSAFLRTASRYINHWDKSGDLLCVYFPGYTDATGNYIQNPTGSPGTSVNGYDYLDLRDRTINGVSYGNNKMLLVNRSGLYKINDATRSITRVTTTGLPNATGWQYLARANDRIIGSYANSSIRVYDPQGDGTTWAASATISFGYNTVANGSANFETIAIYDPVAALIYVYDETTPGPTVTQTPTPSGTPTNTPTTTSTRTQTPTNTPTNTSTPAPTLSNTPTKTPTTTSTQTQTPTKTPTQTQTPTKTSTQTQTPTNTPTTTITPSPTVVNTNPYKISTAIPSTIDYITVNGDGNTVVVGSKSYINNKGIIKSYKRVGNLYWHDKGQPIIGSSNFTYLGPVAISKSGNTMVVGAPEAGGPGYAAVYDYNEATNKWLQSGYNLYPSVSSEYVQNNQGVDVAISGDGNTVAVMALSAQNSSTPSRIQVYKRSAAADITDKVKLLTLKNASYFTRDYSLSNNLTYFSDITSILGRNTTNSPYRKRYFAGGTDYTGTLHITGNQSFLKTETQNIANFGTGDFTIEGWIQPVDYSGASSGIMPIITCSGANSQTLFSVTMDVATGFLRFGRADNPTSFGIVSVNLSRSRIWSYFAVCRESGVTRMWVMSNNASASSEPILCGTTSALSTVNFANPTRIAIGAYADSAVATNGVYTPGVAGVFVGNICDIRITKGRALYNTFNANDLLPPTSPLTSSTYTTLLLKFNNAAVVNKTGDHVISTTSIAPYTSTTPKFDTRSFFFTYTSAAAGTPHFRFRSTRDVELWSGNAPFTIEFWARFNTTEKGNYVYYNVPGSGSGIQIYREATGRTMRFWGNNSVFAISDTAIDNLEWNHFAFVYRPYATTDLQSLGYTDAAQVASLIESNPSYYFRNKVDMYVNGQLQINKKVAGTEVYQGTAPTGVGFTSYAETHPLIGGYVNTTGTFNAGQLLMDEFRYTGGRCRYTANFTPPTARYSKIPDPYISDVIIYLSAEEDTSNSSTTNHTFTDSSPLSATIVAHQNISGSGESFIGQGPMNPYGDIFPVSIITNGQTYMRSAYTGQTIGTQPFTIEFWINSTYLGLPASNNVIMALGGGSGTSSIPTASSAGKRLAISLERSGATNPNRLNVIYPNNAHNASLVLYSDDNGVISGKGTWFHCAVVRDASSNLFLYVNGKNTGKATGASFNFSTSTIGAFSQILIGADLDGFSDLQSVRLADIRITEGEALYYGATGVDSDVSPDLIPKSPLTLERTDRWIKTDEITSDYSSELATPGTLCLSYNGDRVAFASNDGGSITIKDYDSLTNTWTSVSSGTPELGPSPGQYKNITLTEDGANLMVAPTNNITGEAKVFTWNSRSGIWLQRGYDVDNSYYSELTKGHTRTFYRDDDTGQWYRSDYNSTSDTWTESLTQIITSDTSLAITSSIVDINSSGTLLAGVSSSDINFFIDTTPEPTPTPTAPISSPTNTRTQTPTSSETPTNTPTPTETPTQTPTPTETPTLTPTETPTPTPTNTETPTQTPTNTLTPTITPSPTIIQTNPDRIRLIQPDGSITNWDGITRVVTDSTGTVVAASYNGYSDSTGVVRVYERNPTNQLWYDKGQPLTGLSSNKYFGQGLAMSKDGNRIAVGAVEFNSPSFNFPAAGFVIVYQYDPVTQLWSNLGNTLTESYTTSNWPKYGYHVALSGDGNTVFVATLYGRGGYSAVYAYTYDGTAWIAKGSRIVPRQPSDIISTSTNYSVLKTTYTGDRVAFSTGLGASIDIFDWNGIDWVSVAGSFPRSTGSSYDYASIDLTEDGGYLMTSALTTTNPTTKVYYWNGGTWSQRGSTIANARIGRFTEEHTRDFYVSSVDNGWYRVDLNTTNLVWSKDVTTITDDDSGNPITSPLVDINGVGTVLVAANKPYIDIYTDTGTVLAVTPTPTPSFTATQTKTPTQTQTPTKTPTKTSTPTKTQTKTPTQTPTQTKTQTQTPTQTKTQTRTPTQTKTQTRTPTQTKTQTPTMSQTKTQTPTMSQTPTNTPTNTPTTTNTPTNTPTTTATRTPFFTPSPTKPRPVKKIIADTVATQISAAGLYVPHDGEYIEAATKIVVSIDNHDGSTPYVYNHSFNSTEIKACLYEVDGSSLVLSPFARISITSSALTVYITGTAGTNYKLVIIG